MIGWLNQFWQSLHPAIQATVGSLAAAVVIVIIGLAIRLIRKLALSSPEEKKNREEKLRTHFDDLKTVVIEAISSETHVFVRSGYLVKGSIGSYSNFPGEFGFEGSDWFRAFEVHFPTVTSKWKRLKGEAMRHNQKRTAFDEELMKALEGETGFPVLEYSTRNPLPFVNKEALNVLFDAQCDIAQGHRLTYGIEKTKSEQRYDRTWRGPYWELTDSLTLAVTLSREEAEKVKVALIGLAKQPNYNKEALNLVAKVKKLQDEFNAFGSELSKEIEFIGKYRVGKKEFKEQDHCPICKKIFE